MNETLYMAFRQAKAWIIKLIFFCCRIFPVNEKKIVVSVREAEGGYGDNPKAIAEKLFLLDKSYEIVWLVKEIDKEFPKEIRKVKASFLGSIYQLATAKVWLDTHWKKYGTLKRKGQIYIQLWHGPIGFKAVGKLRGDNLPLIAEKTIKENVRMIDLFVSNSDWCSNIYRQAFWYEGEILQVGSPRMDSAINGENIKNLLKEEYGVDAGCKVALYAPTVRGGMQKTTRKFTWDVELLDCKQLRTVLEEKFGGRWYIMLRLHPHLATLLKGFENCSDNHYIIDISGREDVYDVMLDVDVLVSDYSSLVFDFAYIHKNIFLYSEDMANYKKSRGFLWDLEEIPFSYAGTQKQLWDNIQDFNENVYQKNLDIFLQQIHLVENGSATERVVEWIVDKMD